VFTARYALSPYIKQIRFFFKGLNIIQINCKLQIVGLSPYRPGFSSWSVSVRFVVDKRTPGQVFLPARWFSPVSIIPPQLHACLHLNTTVMRTSGRSLVTFKQSNALSVIGEQRTEQYCHIYVPKLKGILIILLKFFSMAYSCMQFANNITKTKLTKSITGRIRLDIFSCK
jgi:hypothetical protein